LSFWKDFDIQCEAKAKNLASEQLWRQAISSGIVTQIDSGVCVD